MTRKHKTEHKIGTRKKRDSITTFQKQITLLFLEMLMMIKLYHWKTTNYSTHKATDELYTKLNENIDLFIEILLGKSGKRIDLTHHKNIRLIDLNSQDTLVKEIQHFKNYLADLNNNSNVMKNNDLLNVRDTILGDLNQFLYLLSFK